MINRGTGSKLEYDVQRNDAVIGPLIAGYQVIRFGVPMIGQYVNIGRRRVTISPAVPGAQYTITAWTFSNDGGRSARPAVVVVTTGKESECIL